MAYFTHFSTLSPGRKRAVLPALCAITLAPTTYASQQVLLGLALSGVALPSLGHVYGRFICGAAITATLVLIHAALASRYIARTYPTGGIPQAARESLGPFPTLIAEAALLMTGVLTVSVSVSIVVQSIHPISLLTRLYLSPLSLGIVGACLLTGVSMTDGARLARIRAYVVAFFVLMVSVLIVAGLVGSDAAPRLTGTAIISSLPPDYGSAHPHPVLGLIGLVIALNAFASGCVAAAGTTVDGAASSDPQGRSSALSVIAAALIFLGIAALCARLHIVFWSGRGGVASPVMEQLAAAVFGLTGRFRWLGVALRLATVAILLAAAQSGLVLAGRIVSRRGVGRYAASFATIPAGQRNFRTGILVAGVLSALVILVFRANPVRQISLYTAGTSILLVVVHCCIAIYSLRERGRWWLISLLFSLAGAMVAAIVCDVASRGETSAGNLAVPTTMAALAGVLFLIRQRAGAA